MSNIQIESDLKEVLGEINSKLGKIQRFAGLKGTVTTVGEPVTQMFRIH